MASTAEIYAGTEAKKKADAGMMSEKELKRKLRESLRKTGMVQHMTAQVGAAHARAGLCIFSSGR
jgi:hypothetical protein